MAKTDKPKLNVETKGGHGMARIPVLPGSPCIDAGEPATPPPATHRPGTSTENRGPEATHGWISGWTSIGIEM